MRTLCLLLCCMYACDTERVPTVGEIHQKIDRDLVKLITMGVPKTGCAKHADGYVTKSCSVHLLTEYTEDDTASICILDDDTVCLGDCVLCVKKIDDKWQEASGWNEVKDGEEKKHEASD